MFDCFSGSWRSSRGKYLVLLDGMMFTLALADYESIADNVSARYNTEEGYN